MRIRRRPPFSSPSPSSPASSPLSDPSFNALPALLLRRDTTKDAAVHSTQQLHQLGDLPTGAHHGAAQGPNRSAPHHQLPVHHLEFQANAKGCSSSEFCFFPPVDDEVLRREELKIEDDEAEAMVDSNNKGCHDAKVNCNKNRAVSGAGALIRLEAAQRLEEESGHGDGGKRWEEKRKGKACKRSRRPPSWSNGCTSDNEKHRVAARSGDDKLPVENGNGGNASASNGKKRRSPAVLMEGSRCSRVNGRGWRCCQKTLVGYSLCEHHLGKGRLKSMSSVRGQIGATTRPKRNPAEGVIGKGAPTSPSPSSDKHQGQDEQQPQHAAQLFQGTK